VVDEAQWSRLVGPVTLARRPQVLFTDEDLEDARRQLILYGRDGLPVLSHDGKLRGWLTRADVLRALTTNLDASDAEIEQGATAAEYAAKSPEAAIHTPSTPLGGYQALELRILPDSPARGRRVDEIEWPPGCLAVAVTQGREIRAARPDMELDPGERVIVLAPAKQTPHRRPVDGADATKVSAIN
jgi:CIC family chloride channel protein